MITGRISGYDATEMNALTTEHLGRSVGGCTLVDDISVLIRAGEVLAVVGPSGAGKSSFLRRMATSVMMLQGGRAIRIGPVAEMPHA